MGRDRHTRVEWGTAGKSKSKGVTDFGHDDHGFELQTVEEKNIYDELKSQGYTVHKNGWPDFMATRDTETRLIEVKSSADRRRHAQLAVHRGLKNLGVEVETRIIENPHRVRRIGYAPTAIRKPKVVIVSDSDDE
jgi:hypothetical protein